MYYWMIAVGIACLFFGSSMVLHHHPTLLHKKKPVRVMHKARHISHRGGCGEYPENTVPAFQNALSQGSQIFEMDLHLTKDGKVVVAHDDDLYRVTGQPGSIKETDYDELPKNFRKFLSLPFPRKPGDFIQTEGVDCHIPTLEELFQTFPDIPFNIDLKSSNPELLRKTHALIKQYKREELIIWGSFRENTCQACYKQDKDIAVIFSAKGVAKLLALHYTGLLPFVPLKESFLEIPAFTERSKELLLANTTPGRAKAIMWIVDNILLRKGLFNHLQKRGIGVFTWVQNDEEDFEYCFKRGVSGVMTDFPTLLAKYLKDNKKDGEDVTLI